MAKTDANKKIDKFLKDTNIEDITVDKVKEIFNTAYVDDYGNYLHASVNYENDQDKVLKLIDCFLELGVDPNHKSKANGLPFVHHALCGYTKGDKDISYPEKFIHELIEMGKRHGLDVNIVDRDGDTIAECAIACDVYTGSVVNIMEWLGPNFTVTDKIVTTLNNYITEASKSNKEWHDRLVNEKEKIENYVKIANLNIDEINELISTKENALTELTTDLNKDNIKDKYKEINELIIDLKRLYEDKKYLDNKSYDIVVINKTCSLIRTILLEMLNDKESLTLPLLSFVGELNLLFSLQDINAQYNIVKSEYDEYLKSLRESAESVETKNQASTYIDSLPNVEIKDELIKIIDAIIATLDSRIKDITSVTDKLKIIYMLLEREYTEVFDFDDSTIADLDNIFVSVSEEHETLLAEVKELIKTRVINLWSFIEQFISNDIVDITEVEEIFKNSTSLQRKK